MAELRVFGVAGLPEVQPGDDLAELIAAAVDLLDDDIVVVTSKVVSKADGRLLPGTDRAAAIAAETVKVVASRGDTVIARTAHGLVLAAAGVDTSNVAPGTVALLPVDPDASAARLRAGLLERTGRRVAVVISDTMGRAWRVGQVDQAIGVAGLAAVNDLRGTTDAFGQLLEVTQTAVADELAAAADLVKGKAAGVPVAVVRGLTLPDGAGGAAALVRPVAEDLFAEGAAEARAAGARAAATAGTEPLRPGPVPEETVRAAAAIAAERWDVRLDVRAAGHEVWVLTGPPFAAGAAVQGLLGLLVAAGLAGSWVPATDPHLGVLRVGLPG